MHQLAGTALGHAASPLAAANISVHLPSTLFPTPLPQRLVLLSLYVLFPTHVYTPVSLPFPYRLINYVFIMAACMLLALYRRRLSGSTSSADGKCSPVCTTVQSGCSSLIHTLWRPTNGQSSRSECMYNVLWPRTRKGDTQHICPVLLGWGCSVRMPLSSWSWNALKHLSLSSTRTATSSEYLQIQHDLDLSKHQHEQ